jgi:predicted dehydrogenase
MNDRLTRRRFVAGSVAFAGGALAFPAASYARIRGANDRVRLGAIGVGSRGRDVLVHLLKDPATDVVALSDVYDLSLAQTVDRIGRAVPTDADYRALLDRTDVDAVLIASPDHWHARMVEDALRAGKDVFIEKPLTREIGEGERLLEIATETDRIVQVGLQQRSGSHYLRAKSEYFDTGLIGRLAQVRMAWYGYSPGRRVLDSQPAGLDWAGWLGPASPRPFDGDQFANWRWYWDFGGGSITDLFTHWIDVVHWFTGSETPATVVALGGSNVLARPRPAPDTVSLLLSYPEGYTVSFDSSAVPSARGWGIEFLGTGGRLWIDRNEYSWTAAEQDAKPVVVKPDEEGSGPHARNFIACVRSRRTPNSDLLSGYRSTHAALLAREAYRSTVPRPGR